MAAKGSRCLLLTCWCSADQSVGLAPTIPLWSLKMARAYAHSSWSAACSAISKVGRCGWHHHATCLHVLPQHPWLPKCPPQVTLPGRS